MQLVEDNSSFVQNREKEVAAIVRSITDLNDIFKDLSTMIVDQVSFFLFHKCFFFYVIFC